MGTIRFHHAFVLCAALIAVADAAAAEQSANGIFLVATSALRDPNFRETVVLVTQPSQSGPFGVVINRPLDRRVTDVLPGYKSKRPREVVHYGGPVARDAVVFLVRTADPPARAIRVLRDVYITGDRETAESILDKGAPGRALRVYAGYSGWAPGQLQHEISRGSWYVLPADAETIFEKDPGKIWPELSQRAALRRTGIAPPPATQPISPRCGAARCG